MGSHDAYGKQVLRLATYDAVEQYGAAVEVDFGVGQPGRIDGAIGGNIAIEIESRTPKQIRGAILDLICHPFPKKLLILLPVHIGNPSSAVKQAESLLSRFLELNAFHVLLLSGSGHNPNELKDAELVATALKKLGYRSTHQFTASESNERANSIMSAKHSIGKYAPLYDYLESLSQSVSEETLGFGRLEKILGFALPASASNYQAWWANQSDVSKRPQARAWLNAGFQVDSVRLSGKESWVRFKRL